MKDKRSEMIDKTAHEVVKRVHRELYGDDAANGYFIAECVTSLETILLKTWGPNWRREFEAKRQAYLLADEGGNVSTLQ